MGGYINESGNYQFAGLGLVRVNVKSTARRVSARWKGGMLHVSAPMSIPYDHLASLLCGWGPQLEQKRPDSPYHIGQTLEMPDFSVTISSQSRLPDKIVMNFDPPRGRIEVGTSWRMEQADTIRAISKLLCRMAQRIAPGVLLPQAREVSRRVGKSPMLWTISNGHRVLGHCDAKGVIALSYALLFYPMHLREYVICHELAHLTELNHSPRFHQICDAYCQGAEAQLRAELRAFVPPIVR